MPDIHRRAAQVAPHLSPDEIATRGFQASFRGVSESEVRSFLRRVADEITAARAREAELNEQLEQLREQLRNPPIVTEERLLDAMGEETARVLRAAQDGAHEIRARAEAAAAESAAASELAATQTREEADTDAGAMRNAAQTAAAKREEEATAYSVALRAETDAAVAELRATTESELALLREQSLEGSASEIEAAKEAGRDLVNEARSVRERILADLGRRRLLLQAQIDELRAGRDRLLDAYRVVKRTLGDATEALVQVEARATHELAGPPPSLEVPPVDGELAALSGELTGEAGAPSVEVEALFARLREQSAPQPGSLPTDEAETEPERSGGEQLGSLPTDVAPNISERTSNQDEPERSGGEPRGSVPTDVAVSEISGSPDDAVGTPEPERSGGEQLGSVPTGVAADISERTSHRDEREAVLQPLQRELGRKVKRTLQDEQNDVLDRIRTVKGRPRADEVLPSAAQQVALLATTLRAPVDAAYAGGRATVGVHDDLASAPSAMVDGLAATMVDRLHARLVEAIDDAGDDDGAVTQRLSARYREFKGTELDAVVGDTLAAAWVLGVYDAAKNGQTLRWIPDEVGSCPDCDDNALEPTVRGEPFPTGQPHPPAHPGCRCLLVIER